MKEFSSKAMFKLIFSQIFSISFLVLLLTMFTVSISYLYPNYYQSVATYKIISKESFEEDQFGFLGGLAQIGKQGGIDSLEVEEVANSNSFITQFIRDNDLYRNLIKDNPDALPSDFSRAFIKRLDFNNLGSYVRISFIDKEPTKAKEILESYITGLDNFFRTRQKEKSARYINYLTEQLETNESYRKQAINESATALIQSELRNLVLAEIDGAYVLEALDPPNTPDRKKYPQRLVWLLLSLFFYSLLVTTAVLIWNFQTAKNLDLFKKFKKTKFE